MTPKELMADLEQNRIKPVYFFYGEEDFKIAEAISALRAKVVTPGADAFNVDQFDGREASVSQIISSAKTLPVMATWRFILVRNADRIKASDLENMMELVEDPSESSCLLLVGEKIDSRKKFFKRISKVGALVKFARTYENELPGWIRYISRKNNKKIEPNAIHLLIEMIGSDLMALSNEIGKISIFIGSKETIELADVEKMVSHIRLSTVFEFADAIGNKDLKTSLKISERLLEAGEQPLFLLSMIGRHYRNLWTASRMSKEGARDQEVAKALRLHPRFASGFLRQLSKSKKTDFPNCFEAILLADHELKTGGGQPKGVFTRLIHQLTAAS